MRFISIAAYLIILSSLAGCVDQDPFGMRDKKIIGNYYFSTGDDPELAFLSWGSDHSTIIDWQVFSVGYNDSFIIAKQHPDTGRFRIDTMAINYYIVPVKKKLKEYSESGVIGPLSLTQFEEKRRQLKIEKIKFTMNAKELW